MKGVQSVYWDVMGMFLLLLQLFATMSLLLLVLVLPLLNPSQLCFEIGGCSTHIFSVLTASLWDTCPSLFYTEWTEAQWGSAVINVMKWVSIRARHPDSNADAPQLLSTGSFQTICAWSSCGTCTFANLSIMSNNNCLNVSGSLNLRHTTKGEILLKSPPPIFMLFNIS